MRILALLFVALALFGAELKIATYNVENLFDGENNGNEYEDFRLESGKWNKTKYKEKLNKIASEILEINADIIALQEIENEGVLKALANKTQYKFYKFSNPKSAPAGVAVLSKIPIISSEYYRMSSVKTRDILRADFEFEGARFSVYALHMLSARNSIGDRKKSFDFLASVIKNKKNSVILGDFNTGIGKNSLLNEILGEGKFVDLWSDNVCFANKLIACKSHDSGALLDHILLSDDFFGKAKFGYKKGSFKAESVAQSSDHIALSFVLSSEKISPNKPKNLAVQNPNLELKEAQISEIYGDVNSAPFILKNAVVTYTNKHGSAISQGSKGVFVYGLSGVSVGDKLDLAVQKAKIYRKKFELSEAKILKNHGNIGSIEKYTLKEINYHTISPGDVVAQIWGDVTDGQIVVNGRKYKIYSKKGKIKNQKNAKFNNAYFTIYDEQKEFIVQ
ncbi:endonuclease/exonuclease/phosphatase family protein [Campylobacter sp. JMF_04 NA10]|uniref:endonuclease/exonuclease/phosphatase family protein n=1 Tax=Campylobacter sp. JMF_04 NA10 TaxID=2983824 RepID=UPI0022E9F1E9|nr:endonuclease/exonuclease/phosphatase family protein [Campylobacter sp. JMF_04 NA10]MDA3075875.1 endonuclease/exonuclease/phosphatase family protein [Campylobacter sp. JMF_04 NA10]